MRPTIALAAQRLAQLRSAALAAESGASLRAARLSTAAAPPPASPLARRGLEERSPTALALDAPPVVHHPLYSAPQLGPRHRFPMQVFQRIHDQLLAKGTVDPRQVRLAAQWRDVCSHTLPAAVAMLSARRQLRFVRCPPCMDDIWCVCLLSSPTAWHHPPAPCCCCPTPCPPFRGAPGAHTACAALPRAAVPGAQRRVCGRIPGGLPRWVGGWVVLVHLG